MLVLTRRIGEVIVINDNVKVTILGMKGNNVKIGIDTPKETTIHREEIYNKIKAKEIEKEKINA